MELYCPRLKSKGTVDILVCLYKCPKSRIVICKEYLSAYPSLLNFEIEERYIEKYGTVIIPIPLALRKRRKRNVKTETE